MRHLFARPVLGITVSALLAISAMGALAQTAPSTQRAPTVAPAAPAAATAPAAAGSTPTAPVTAGAQPSAGPSAAPAAATESVVNPYGLSALWNGGDTVARGTLVALLTMSLGSWFVIITKLVDQTLVARQARQAERMFWSAPNPTEGAAQLGKGSAFRMIVEQGLSASVHREDALTAQIDRQSWVTLSLQHAADILGNRLQGGLAFLATVGSTAPFVGLFGTVWGIYHALTEIGIAGQASIDKVAGPVGEALIMTAMGLAVAVPAVLGYNWLIRRNKILLDRVRSFTADLVALFTTTVRPAARPVSARTA